MGKNIENFRDELVKFANIVEIIENTFIGDDKVEIITYVNENTFKEISKKLNTEQDNKCVISIENVNFTFLKK
jgi:hypothetical protein